MYKEILMLKITFHKFLEKWILLILYLKKSYLKAVEVKNERTKASANKSGPKGTRQNATAAQEVLFFKQKKFFQIIIYKNRKTYGCL